MTDGRRDPTLPLSAVLATWQWGLMRRTPSTEQIGDLLRDRRWRARLGLKPEAGGRADRAAEVRHAGGDEARFFAQFSARQFFGIDSGRLPSPLRQFQAPLLHGIAELLDEVDCVALDGQYGGAIVLVHHAIDAARAVTALYLVFAHAQPGIAVHLAAT